MVTKLLRNFLGPLISVPYGLILRVRHLLYDKDVFEAYSHPNIPIICIGNLELGGTGKTPFTIMLANSLTTNYKIGIVSRGYGRKSKGFYMVEKDMEAAVVGDEPKLIYESLKGKIPVAVCESRQTGISRLIEEFPDTNLIILDDAFQHRKVKADLNILLTPYSQPYFNNQLLPLGTLRDVKSAACRSDFTVFTGTPKDANEKTALKGNEFYAFLNYGPIYHAISMDTVSVEKDSSILLVTGIARPGRLSKYLESIYKRVLLLDFPDHHNYSEKSIDKALKIFNNFAGDKKWVITTEKDLIKVKPLLKNYPDFAEKWLVQPITCELQELESLKTEIEKRISERSR